MNGRAAAGRSPGGAGARCQVAVLRDHGSLADSRIHDSDIMIRAPAPGAGGPHWQARDSLAGRLMGARRRAAGVPLSGGGAVFSGESPSPGAHHSESELSGSCEKRLNLPTMLLISCSVT